ncbi:MAG: toxic anion resistance protein [Neptunomonas phycophila]|uniref:toxic anion resistance protein n=1 Tax=Neptunomonas phycophila TaxID=1572645 RepID=UPI003B8D3D7C
MAAQATMTKEQEQVSALQAAMDKSFADADRDNQMLTVESITKAVPTTDPKSINTDNISPENKQYVDGIVSAIMSENLTDPDTQLGLTELMSQFHSQELEKAVFESEKLNGRMLEYAGHADGGELLDKLTECDQVMNNLHPKNNGLKNKWWHYIPFVMKPMRKYMLLVQSQKDVLEGFKSAIEEGIKERQNDVRILKRDKTDLKKLALMLESSIEAAMYLDESLSHAAVNETDEKKKVFIQSEMVYTLRKTIEGLQEQLIVVNQGQMAMEQIIRLLDILCNSAKRTMNVAMLALKIAMVIAAVLSGAKDLINKTNHLKQTANNFLDDNRESLDQVTDQVIELDTSSTLEMDVVERVFDSIHNNANRTVQARLDNLDNVRDRINQYDSINKRAKETVESMDKGNQAANNLNDKLGLKGLPSSIAVTA